MTNLIQRTTNITLRQSGPTRLTTRPVSNRVMGQTRMRLVQKALQTRTLYVNQGLPGPQGVGVPVGGTTGQALVKASGTDYDTEWATVSGSGEANTASNVGAGQGVFKAKSGVDLQFFSLAAAANDVSVTLDGDTIKIGVVESNFAGIPQSAVTNLTTDLAGKVDENPAITAATKTKITYDVKGLVTGGADATTADIAPSTDRQYLTDAQQTVVQNTSGVNTGDQNAFTTLVVAGQSNVVADQPGDTLTIAAGTSIAITTNAGADTVTIAVDGLDIGSDVQAWDSTLDALAAFNTNGFMVQTAADTFGARTMTGTSNRITVTNGDGTVGNPTFDIAATYVGQSSITTLGTVTTGTWQATQVGILYGGTGATTASGARTNLGLGNSATRDVGTGSGDVAAGDHTHTSSAITDFNSAVDARIAASTLAITDTFVVADETARLALTDAERGDVAIQTDDGSSWILGGANDPSDPADWFQLGVPGSAPVTSVNGQTGAVVLTTADVADSTNKRYVTDAHLTILGDTSGTNTGDQNTFSTIAVSGQSNVVADATTDTLTLAAGANIAITTNASTDTVTFAVTGLTIGSDVQAFDADLSALAALTGTNTIYYRSGVSTWTAVTVGTGLGFSGGTLSATGVSVTDGDKGDITVSSTGTVWTIDNGVVTYAKMQATSTTDVLLGRSSSGGGTIQEIACTSFARSILDDVDASAVRSTLGLVIGTNVQAYDATLAALAAYNSNGLVCQTAADTFTSRTITGTASRISVTNGDGVSGQPTIDIHSSYAGQTSITTLGTVTTGYWAGTAVDVAYGGTGSNTPAGARSALQLEYGVHVMAYDAGLQALAGNTPAANKLPYYTGSTTSAMTDFTAAGRALVGLANAAFLVCGRLTLESGVPVSTSDQSAKSTIYFTPDGGDVVCIYDGTRFVPRTFAELSRSISGLTSGKNYDVVAYWSGSAVVIDLALAWTSDTARNTAFSLLNGIWVNTSSFTTVMGSVSISANQATLLGTIRTTATNQTEDSQTKRFVSNLWRPAIRHFNRTDATNHTYSSTTVRGWNNASTHCLEWVTCIPRNSATLTLNAAFNASGAGSQGARVGVGSVTTAHIQWLDWNSTIIPGLAIPLVVAPAGGYNIYYVTESATGSGNSNYYYYTFGGGVWN
jgi:hypothetical protein